MNIVYQNPSNLRHRSDTVIHNGIAYLSGAISSDPSLDIKGQAAQVLAELDARLSRAGTDKRNLLSATIYMTDVNGEVRAFNEVWNAWLVTGREPVRCCVQAVLQGGAKVEVALTAAIPESTAGNSH